MPGTRMAESGQDRSVEPEVTVLYVSSFNLSGNSNDVLIGNEIVASWAPTEEPPPTAPAVHSW